jgi:hypothetical protein
MSEQQTSERNGVTISRASWIALLAAIVLVVILASIMATYVVTSSYYVGHPQISTVNYSTTATVSQTETDTSYSTLTQTSVSTSISTQNPNYYYGKPNYPNYNPNYNPYPNYQCQYPYYNSQYCYGNQYQSYSGTVSQSGTCILFYTSTGTYYLDLSHLNGNPYPSGSVTIYGYVESNYYQGPCGEYPLLYVVQV